MRHHPDWLKVKIGGGEVFVKMKSLLRNAKLHTICEEAKCPNIAECFGSGTAVFLILGNICSRNCGYCNVKHGTPLPLNKNEPKDVAESVKKLGLNYAVITSVTRDDLEDGGASVFYETVSEIKKLNKNCKVEVLIPDFKGNFESLKKVVVSGADVINHNIEVVQQLFPVIRPQGDYNTSITLLKNIKKINNKIKTKSGFMVGLGENKNQVIQTMNDLRKADVDFLTIGQYLQPTKNHVEIKKYYTPQEFDEFKKIALGLGFKHVESGPLVRSSYHAEKAMIY
ncbi:MAG: lipoyl synthase [Candidatus Thermoplasmatota archaeon]|jgi:lipoic acid synthetase|nr:lipoyl synthase [Candidatus Thermoplasmatota archaeon]